MGAVAESDDVSVVALHVAAVEELVEGGGEMVLVAGGVLCGACWCEAVFDVVPRVHGSLLFLSVVFCLFLCAPVACFLPRACGESRGVLYARVGVSHFARVFLLVMVPWCCCRWQSMIVGGYCGRFRAWREHEQ